MFPRGRECSHRPCCFALCLRLASRANRILCSGSSFYGHETDVKCVFWTGDKKVTVFAKPGSLLSAGFHRHPPPPLDFELHKYQEPLLDLYSPPEKCESVTETSSRSLTVHPGTRLDSGQTQTLLLAKARPVRGGVCQALPVCGVFQPVGGRPALRREETCLGLRTRTALTPLASRADQGPSSSHPGGPFSCVF